MRIDGDVWAPLHWNIPTNFQLNDLWFNTLIMVLKFNTHSLVFASIEWDHFCMFPEERNPVKVSSD